MRVRKTFGAGLLGLTALLLLVAACSGPAHPVARVDQKWITQEQWKIFCRDHHIPEASGAQVIKEGLTRLVRREVAVALAERKGLLKGEGWENRLNAMKKQAEVRAFLEKRLAAKPKLTPAELERRFDRDQEARHVLVVTCAANAQAQKALEALKKGKPFGKVQAQYSQHVQGLPDNGDLGWMRKDELPDALQGPVFKAAEGAVLGPLQTGQVWTVVVVKGIKRPSHQDFLKNENQIRDHYRQERLAGERKKALSDIRGKYPLTVHQDVMDLVLEQKARRQDLDKVVAGVAGRKIRLGDLLGAFQQMSQQSGRLPLDRDTLARILDALSDEARLQAAAKAAGAGKTQAAQALLWDMKHEMAAQLFIRNYLETLPIPDATLQNFYQKHAQEFKVPDRLHVRYLIGASRRSLKQAQDMAERGAAWSKVTHAPGVSQETGDGDFGWISASRLAKVIPAAILQTLENSQPGQWAGGPVPGGRYGLFQLVDIQRGAVPPLSKIVQNVKSAYLQQNGRQLAYDYLDGPGREGISIKVFPGNAALYFRKAGPGNARGKSQPEGGSSSS